MRRLEVAARVLVLAQVAHGLTPAGTESEGYVGAVGGFVPVIAACGAVYGVRPERPR